MKIRRSFIFFMTFILCAQFVIAKTYTEKDLKAAYDRGYAKGYKDGKKRGGGGTGVDPDVASAMAPGQEVFRVLNGGNTKGDEFDDIFQEKILQNGQIYSVEVAPIYVAPFGNSPVQADELRTPFIQANPMYFEINKDLTNILDSFDREYELFQLQQ